MRRLSKALAGALLASAVALPAFAQQLQLQPIPTTLPQAATAVSAPLMAPAPAAPVQAPAVDPTALPPVAGAPGAAPAEPDYKLPQGATLGDSADKIKKLSTDNAKSLKDLVGTATDNTRDMDAAAARAQDKRDIDALNVQLQKVKLAKEIYKTLNADDDKSKEELAAAKADNDKLAAQVKGLEEQLLTTSKQLQSQQVKPQGPNPVVVSILGSGRDLLARILVPVTGETPARVGDTLSNGMKVASITADGVTVSQGGETVRLSFGTTVPGGTATARR